MAVGRVQLNRPVFHRSFSTTFLQSPTFKIVFFSFSDSFILHSNLSLLLSQWAAAPPAGRATVLFFFRLLTHSRVCRRCFLSSDFGFFFAFLLYRQACRYVLLIYVNLLVLWFNFQNCFLGLPVRPRTVVFVSCDSCFALLDR